MGKRVLKVIVHVRLGKITHKITQQAVLQAEAETKKSEFSAIQFLLDDKMSQK